jgi:hypothetical protein
MFYFWMYNKDYKHITHTMSLAFTLLNQLWRLYRLCCPLMMKCKRKVLIRGTAPCRFRGERVDIIVLGIVLSTRPLILTCNLNVQSSPSKIVCHTLFYRTLLSYKLPTAWPATVVNVDCIESLPCIKPDARAGHSFSKKVRVRQMTASFLALIFESLKKQASRESLCYELLTIE